MKISQQGGDLCCGPRFLGGGAKGEEEISISANTLEVDAGYLGSTCKPPCEQQGTEVLMKASDRRVGLAAVVAGTGLWCRRQPGPADIILLGKERVETVSICSMVCWDAVLAVFKSTFLPVLCL